MTVSHIVKSTPIAKRNLSWLEEEDTQKPHVVPVSAMVDIAHSAFDQGAPGPWDAESEERGDAGSSISPPTLLNSWLLRN
ncbi:hypothetical protein MMC08_007157 [Hypocenomyce scalaris]|nr:hypothetical protein [Hypocenomyce scalaris]